MCPFEGKEETCGGGWGWWMPLVIKKEKKGRVRTLNSCFPLVDNAIYITKKAL